MTHLVIFYVTTYAKNLYNLKSLKQYFSEEFCVGKDRGTNYQ